MRHRQLVELIARQPTKSQLAAFTTDIADLKPGDFVVHTTHGVGQFLGVRQIVQGDQKGDFMLIEYAAESKLYVPLTRLDLVQKYRGAGEAKPHLDRLGGVTWEKTKSRVKAKMRDMADELLKLYAQRRMVHGFAFSSDSNWQREFEDAFEYTPTKDQLTAMSQALTRVLFLGFCYEVSRWSQQWPENFPVQVFCRPVSASTRLL